MTGDGIGFLLTTEAVTIPLMLLWAVAYWLFGAAARKLAARAQSLLRGVAPLVSGTMAQHGVTGPAVTDAAATLQAKVTALVDALLRNIEGIAAFVRACAWSHFWMAVFAAAMIWGMGGLPDSGWAVALLLGMRVVPVLQLLFGGVLSLIKVFDFRQDLKMPVASLRDVFAGMRGGRGDEWSG